MTMNPLPPQAYTKETLVKAYQWLQHQNGNIKEIASNPDILVSLFLKAKLQGDSALERPSIQNFKKELKNLAGMMGEFEVVEMRPPETHSTHQAPLPGLSGYSSASGSTNMSQPTASAQAQSHRTQMLAQAQITPPPPTRASSAPAPAPAPAENPESLPVTATRQLFPDLDTRSWLMIQEVKNQMNLSSETEAFRLLISVGHTKLKSLMSDK
ncbi:MAG: hypothetical protein ACK5P7_10570 [Bdellovibrio sp.]|jgi:hypothetical protein